MKNTSPNFNALNKFNKALKPMNPEEKILIRKRWEYNQLRGVGLSFDEFLRTDKK